MNEEDAKALAREFLSKQISLMPTEEKLYRHDPENEFCFSFNLSGLRGYGGSEYVSVCKTTGEVTNIGFHGE